MVGGSVIGIARGSETTLLHVQDSRQGGKVKDECSVRCIERRISDGVPIRIDLGDSVWWQSGRVMWTPKENRKPEGSGQRCGADFDIQIPKVGYSR